MTSLRASIVIVIVLLNGERALEVRAEHPIDAIAKTMKWTDELRGYDVELTIHQNGKSAISGKLVEVVAPESRNDGSFSEWVQKLHEWKKADGSFAVVLAKGVSRVSTFKGDTKHNETATSRIAIGDPDGGRILDWEGSKLRQGDLLCGGKDRPCDKLSREFDWSHLPLYFNPALFQLSHKNARTFEKTIELVGLANQDDIHVEKTQINKKSVKIYRVKINDVNEDGLRVLKITVSDEGFDSGLVVEMKDLFLKKEKSKGKYVSDDQVLDAMGGSVAIEWKLVDHGQKKTLVPVNLTLKDQKLEYSQKTMNITAKWRLEEPESMTVDSLEKLCKELQQDVDRALGRQPLIKKKGT
jgi:hypothetical protein